MKRHAARLLALLLTLTLTLGLLPGVSFAAEIIASGTCGAEGDGSNLTWTLDSAGTLTISGTGEMADWIYTSDIPWENVKTAALESGVTSIGNYAFFYFSSLTSVTIPASVTSIGEYAFRSCSSLTSVTIPDSVTSIGGYAFEGCSSLTSVTIPDSVTSIGDYAFAYCSSLTSVTIPDSVTSIGQSAFDGCISLTSVTIPDSVTSIGNGAFFDCSRLTSVTFPDSVTSIGNYAFWGCSSLTSVTIPDSVTSIGDSAFAACSALESITVEADNSTYCSDNGVLFTKDMSTLVQFPAGSPSESYAIPDGVTSIGGGAFEYCISLTSVTIPDSVTSIGDGAFAGCSSLTSVTIPDSVTSIEDWAFSGCGALTDVYYSGSESDWRAISIGGSNDPLNSATIHFNSTGPDAACSAPFSRSDGDFSFRSLLAGDADAHYTYNYDENWFLQPSTAYQHELVKMSVRGAMAAYGADGHESSPRNIEALMNDLRFTHIEADYPAPEADSIGYAIGSKNIRTEDGEEFSLLMVTVRGGGYYDEWGGNFRVGAGVEHEGFSIAANNVYDGILNYLSRHGRDLCAVKKLWVMGYSRAAATTNLVAKKLDDLAAYPRTAPFLHDNIYAFCFECPQTTRAFNTGVSASGARYDNIVCIVNPIDFVPKVPLSAWDYSRYGKTYYLPYKEGVVSLRFAAQNIRMRQEYKKLLDYNGIPAPTKLVPTLPAQAAILDKAFDGIGAALSLEAYNQGLQEKMIDLALENLAKGGNMVERIDHIKALLVAFPGAWFLADAAEDLMLAHYAELCLCWLDSLEGDIRSDFAAPRYDRIFINCPVDIAVYDGEGNLVGLIRNNEVQAIENSVAAYIDENGQKVIDLPTKESYSLQLSATDDGTVTYTATQIAVDTGTTEQVVSFMNIEISKGDTLTGAVAPAEDGEDSVFTFSKGETVLTPDISQKGDEVSHYTITVTEEEGGTVQGGGTFVPGEYARVRAEAEEGYRFAGWYDGETLFSSEAEVRFPVERELALTARFKIEADPVPDLNGDGAASVDDVRALFAHVAGAETLADAASADLNSDGKVNNRDAILLFRRLAGGNNQ